MQTGRTQKALEESAEALQSTLRTLSTQLVTLSSVSNGRTVEPSSIGSTADAIGKVTQALSCVRQLQWSESQAQQLWSYLRRSKGGRLVLEYRVIIKTLKVPFRRISFSICRILLVCQQLYSHVTVAQDREINHLVDFVYASWSTRVWARMFVWLASCHSVKRAVACS